MTSVKVSHSNWEFDILQQLDSYAEEYDFPMLNNVYFYNADIRLTAFRNSSEWLIVFEEIAVSEKQYAFVNSVSAYGNKIEKAGAQQAITVISEVPGKPIWDENRNFLLDRWNFDVVINGKIRNFTPSPKDYKRAKVDVESNIKVPAQILSLLTFLIPNEFFLTDGRLLEICDRTNSNLEKFIQMEDWYHPNIADDELPSQSECLRSLALAIARNDQDLYTCPEEALNTHWSNWEEE